MEKWNQGIFTTEPGLHPHQNIFDEPVLIDNGHNDLVPVDLTVGLLIERSLFFGHLPVPKLSGFRDELSGNVITNAFTIGLLSTEEVFRQWHPIQPGEELPVNPVLTLTGLVGWVNARVPSYSLVPPLPYFVCWS
jgi:hypothetical protein